MRNAHIAIMLPRFSRYGGVEQFGFRLAETLGAKGYPVDFICARREVDAPANVAVLETGRPVGPRWLKMLVFANRAETIRRANRYDCVISLGKTWNQNILRVGGGPLPQFWKLSEQAYPQGFPRCIKKLQRRLNPANFLTRRMETAQYKNADRIVAVSHFVHDLILTANPETKPDRVTIIYNRPDLARFSHPSPEERTVCREIYGIAPGDIAIGLATSNFQLKGTAPLIKALAQLPPQCVLLVAGGRNSKKYRELAEKINIAGRVRFLGTIADMPSWYKAIDIFALPSFYDACSNAVLEALASGLPTLSSAANGSSYFLPPENVVANPGDDAELARVLSRLVNEARHNAESGSREIFAWPETVASGMEAFVALVEEYIESNRNNPVPARPSC